MGHLHIRPFNSFGGLFLADNKPYLTSKNGGLNPTDYDEDQCVSCQLAGKIRKVSIRFLFKLFGSLPFASFCFLSLGLGFTFWGGKCLNDDRFAVSYALFVLGWLFVICALIVVPLG